MRTKTPATIEDLYHVPENGKAEIVNGELVIMAATGGLPSRASFNIAMSLRLHEKQFNGGFAFGDNAGFIVSLPNRQSFSPDAAFHKGPVTMKFLDGAPAFAVEVRSDEDYGPAAEKAMAAKRADYFAAGTSVVWDVDLKSEDVVRVYRASDPGHPIICRHGEIVNAEPVLPGWRMPVDEIFA